MHGRGVYIWKDGRKYEGEYLNDKKHGFGVYTWADGRRYEGNWAHGKQHGQGKYILPDGTFKIGVWDNGMRIKWVDGEDQETGADHGNYQPGQDYGQSGMYGNAIKH